MTIPEECLGKTPHRPPPSVVLLFMCMTMAGLIAPQTAEQKHPPPSHPSPSPLLFGMPQWHLDALSLTASSNFGKTPTPRAQKEEEEKEDEEAKRNFRLRTYVRVLSQFSSG